MTEAFPKGFSGPEAFRPKQARSQLYLDRIVEGAIKLINRDGPDGLTMTALAELAGLSVGGIYRRFADKAELEVFLKDFYLTRFEGDVRKAFAQPSANLEKVISVLFDIHVSRIQDNENFWRFIVSEISDETVRYERGMQAYARVEEMFANAALKHRAEIAQADPKRALKAAFKLAFAILTFRLRVVGPMADSFAWFAMRADGKRAILAYLTAPIAETSRGKSRK